MVTLRNVAKTYHHRGQTVNALCDINLEVEAGEIFGIIGRSGAGKSTLIRIINLLERPDSGEVIVAGQSLTELSISALRQVRHHIGMIFQHFNLLANSSVYQNIALPLKLTGCDRKTIDERVAPLLALTGLEEKRDHYPAQLSGGQKQRVAIARALVTQPKVLLCDEATSALDPETTLSILALLKKINQQYNLSIIMITHEMEVIKEIADRVAIIDQGQIIEQNSVVQLFTRPQTDIGKTFVGSTLANELPHELAEKIVAQAPDDNYAKIVRLTYHHNASGDPTISELVRQFGLTVNILQGSIEGIRNETIGVLLVELSGEAEAISRASDYLHSKDIDIEVIGYVQRHH